MYAPSFGSLVLSMVVCSLTAYAAFKSSSQFTIDAAPVGSILVVIGIVLLFGTAILFGMSIEAFLVGRY